MGSRIRQRSLPLENRQRKGRGLARARLGGADHIATGKHHRDGLLLDGRRLDITHFLHRIGECIIEAELGKSVVHLRDIHRRWRHECAARSFRLLGLAAVLHAFGVGAGFEMRTLGVLGFLARPGRLRRTTATRLLMTTLPALLMFMTRRRGMTALLVLLA